MSRTTVILLLVGTVVLATGDAVRRAASVAKGREATAEWRRALIGPVVLMETILLVNALAFVSLVEIASVEAPEGGSLLRRHLSLILGTAGLMFLMASAVDDPRVRGATTPSEAGGAVLDTAVRRLIFRFWWAALGLGLVFGVAAPGVALFLAMEITLAWGLGKVLERSARQRSVGRT